MDITYSKPSSDISRMRTQEMGFSLDITGKVRENAAYGKEELKSAEEIAQMAGMTDVSVQRDYMAVMSNSMSDEDFAKLMEDGVNPTSIPAGETVTNLDRIKIKMAESGVTIAGYNDDLTEDDIKAVLGNSINAGKIIADTLTASDLPDTGDNVSQIKETVMMAQNLKPLSDEAMAFMIREDMAPTVDNLYRAEYSALYRLSTVGAMSSLIMKAIASSERGFRFCAIMTVSLICETLSPVSGRSDAVSVSAMIFPAFIELPRTALISSSVRSSL